MNKRRMRFCKLDSYDYQLYPGTIRINLEGTNDSSLVDIMSEIERADNQIYVEGIKYTYINEYRIFNRKTHVYVELYVTETV